jgi:hypothetical protein
VLDFVHACAGLNGLTVIWQLTPVAMTSDSRAAGNHTDLSTHSGLRIRQPRGMDLPNPLSASKLVHTVEAFLAFLALSDEGCMDCWVLVRVAMIVLCCHLTTAASPYPWGPGQ